MLNYVCVFVINFDLRGKFMVNWVFKIDNVDVDMDLVEGRLWCRKGKKVRLVLWLKIVLYIYC